MRLLTILLCLPFLHGFMVTMNSRHRVITTIKLNQAAEDEISTYSRSTRQTVKDIQKLMKSLVLTSLVTFSVDYMVPSIVRAADESALYSNEYIDNRNRFSIIVPPSWIIMKTKVPTPTLVQYQIEDTLLVANNVADGLSISVTRSDVLRLLKDFEIEWWFAPFDSLRSIGKPELIARLLILQRQSEFEKKETTSVVNSAALSEDGQTLSFQFTTPLGMNRNRETTAVTYFRNNKLTTLWVSSSYGLSERSEGSSLSKQAQQQSIINSFKLI